MEYEDRRTISTPEGVQLALPLAGIGTRFMALAIDLLIGFTVLTLAVLAAGALDAASASPPAGCSRSTSATTS